MECNNCCISLVGGCQSEKSPYNARYEDGKLYYEGEWYEMVCLLYHSFSRNIPLANPVT